MAKSNQPLCVYCYYQDICPHYDETFTQNYCEIMQEFEDKGF